MGLNIDDLTIKFQQQANEIKWQQYIYQNKTKLNRTRKYWSGKEYTQQELYRLATGASDPGGQRGYITSDITATKKALQNALKKKDKKSIVAQKKTLAKLRQNLAKHDTKFKGSLDPLALVDEFEVMNKKEAGIDVFVRMFGFKPPSPVQPSPPASITQPAGGVY